MPSFNAFFPGSSCKLSTQYIIQDHMATHYRKLLSAKAAVDTSAPKSLHNSIKFKDQQNKEKLIKAVERYKKEIQQICSTSPPDSSSNFPEQWKRKSANNKNLQLYCTEREFPITNTGQYSHIQKTITQPQSPTLIARDTMRRIEEESYHKGDLVTALIQPHRNLNQLTHRVTMKKKYQDPQKKTYNGDLLDKHAGRFTSTEQPFKPRLLKKATKSFLSKYKYYMAPTKKNTTDESSPKADQNVIAKLKEMYRYSEDKNLRFESTSQEADPGTENHNALGIRHSQRLAQDEDLKYLHFLQELTDDILIRGCGSSRAIEHVFQEHLQRKRHDIDEAKKKRICQELKDELETSNKLEFSISYDGTQYSTDTVLPRGNLARLPSSHKTDKDNYLYYADTK
ncbi:hypothetical protein FKM82_010217 [Ascaphus truei]